MIFGIPSFGPSLASAEIRSNSTLREVRLSASYVELYGSEARGRNGMWNFGCCFFCLVGLFLVVFVIC